MMSFPGLGSYIILKLKASGNLQAPKRYLEISNNLKHALQHASGQASLFGSPYNEGALVARLAWCSIKCIMLTAEV